MESSELRVQKLVLFVKNAEWSVRRTLIRGLGRCGLSATAVPALHPYNTSHTRDSKSPIHPKA